MRLSTPPTPSPTPRAGSDLKTVETPAASLCRFPPTPQATPNATLVLTPTEIDIPSLDAEVTTASDDTSSPTVVSQAASTPEQVTTHLKLHDILRIQYPNNDKLACPAICTVGGQSAGKSSVLSAVLGVRLQSLRNKIPAVYTHAERCQIELHCGERTATHGPTRIASRATETPFSMVVDIQVTSPRDGTIKMHHFGTIFDKNQTALALWFAGEEARRAWDGLLVPRTWRSLHGLSTAQKESYQQEGRGWPLFTENTVVVTISGPQRAQFDIIDLPGLNENVQAENIVSRYIAKKENIILYCVPAGGPDLTSQQPEIRLIKRYDPNGSRCVAALTFADKINPNRHQGSTWVDFLVDQSPIDFRVAGGWWPLSLRGWQDREAGISETEIRSREIHLFSRPGWSKLQEEAGRRFGVEGLSQKLEDIFAVHIASAYTQTRQALRQIHQTNQEWIKTNPAIKEPVTYLHDGVVNAFINSLKASFHHDNSRGGMHNVHANMEQMMLRHLPEPVALAQDEVSEAGKSWRSWYASMGLVSGGERRDNIIYMDQLLDQIDRHTSRRIGLVDTEAIIQLYIDEFSKKWLATAIEHVEIVWREVERLRIASARQIAGGNPSMERLILHLSSGLAEASKTRAIDFIATYHRMICIPPAEVQLSHHPRHMKMLEHALVHFRSQYTLGASPPASPTASGTGPSSAAPRLLEEHYSVEQREQCFKIQARIVTTLSSNVNEFALAVGRGTLLLVLEHINEMSKTLRQGLSALRMCDRKSRKGRVVG
ncbi:hypothetical protein IAU60_003322 [Kwoniella sp. DSM 27419]